MLPGEATQLMVPASPQTPEGHSLVVQAPSGPLRAGRLGNPGPGGVCVPAEVSPAVPGPS